MTDSPNQRAAVQRRSSLLVWFEHHWPGVPERGRSAKMATAPRWFCNQAFVTTVFLWASMVLVSAETRALIPDHDWTFCVADTAWGIRGYGDCTVAMLGWDSFILPVHFYWFVTVAVIGLATAAIGGVYLLPHRRVHE